MKVQRQINVYLDGSLVETVIVYPDLSRSDEVTISRVAKYLNEDELEFLRDEFVQIGENVPGYPEEVDIEAFDFADLIHDEIEIRKYGFVVSDGSVRDD